MNMEHLGVLRYYLFCGLLAHKLTWEVMKRRSAEAVGPSTGPRPLRLMAVKAVKIAILLAILLQTLLPPALPIHWRPALLTSAGIVLYTAGLALALAGRIQLGGNWLDIENAAVKRDQQVVSRGVYRLVRHPIYMGDLLLLVGLEVALNSWFVLAAILLIPVVLRQTIQEERLLRRTLPGYIGYCERTKRFLPFVA